MNATFSIKGYIKSINAYNSANGQYDFVVIKPDKKTSAIGINIFDADLMEKIEDHEGELVTIDGSFTNYRNNKGNFQISFTATEISFKDAE